MFKWVETKLRKNTGNKSRGLGGRLIFVVGQSGRQNFAAYKILQHTNSLLMHVLTVYGFIVLITLYQ